MIDVGFYYLIPLYLTVLYAFSYFLVFISLKVFDCCNSFWDKWEGFRKDFPPLIIVEIAYFGAVLYYIVYYELSGTGH